MRSAKTFAMEVTWVDWAVCALLALAAGGTAYFRGEAAAVAYRVAAAALAAVSVCSAFVIIRGIVPFKTRLSLVHMQRLRLPFCVWVLLLFVVAGWCGGARLFLSAGVESVQLTLMLLALALTVRFFQSGSFVRPALAAACAGGATGLSAFGALVPVTVLVARWYMARKLMGDPDFVDFEDRPHPDVVRYFAEPVVHTIVKGVAVACFVAAAALAVYLVPCRAGGFPEVVLRWLGCINREGLAYLAMTAMLPLVLAFGGASSASDAIERGAFGGFIYALVYGGAFFYLALTAVAGFFLVKPELILALSEHELHVAENVFALATFLHLVTLSLSGLMLFANLFCFEQE